MKRIKLNGLVAATHTPFTPEGTLNLPIVEKQAEHPLRAGLRTVFISGTTGEAHSLESEARRQLVERWMQVTEASLLRVVIHVGSTSLTTAKMLAAPAEKLGALERLGFFDWISNCQPKSTLSPKTV
jgi:N-acetylneuraminate lyase